MLLNVWATWCPSCRVEHPYLNQLKAQGIKIVEPTHLEAWESIARKSIEDLVESGGISADIVDTFQQHLIDFRSSSAE